MAFSPETYALLVGKINGGGGGCGVFPVNFTVEDGQVTEVDKTVSEIQEAVNSGKLIVGLCNGLIFYESSADTTAGFYLYLDSVNYDVNYIEPKRIAYDSDEQAWFYSESEYDVGGGVMHIWTPQNSTTGYVDEEMTTTVEEYYGNDQAAAYAGLSAQPILVHWKQSSSDSRTSIVVNIYWDKIDETYSLYYFKAGVTSNFLNTIELSFS